MKIVMPVAGKGSRLWPHTHVIPKALIRVAGKPIIQYIIEQLQTVDFSEMIFIIGHLGEQIRDHLEGHYSFPMSFMRQREYNGLGHAIYQSKKAFDKDEDILVVLGDIIFNTDILAAIKSPHNRIGALEVEDPRKFGVLMTDAEGFVTNMLEKPERPPSKLAIAGIYYFKSAYRLFSAVEYLMKEKIQTRNEYQLTDAMKNMMYGGEKFQTFEVFEWYDCGDKDSLLDTNKIMLSRHATNDRMPGSIIIPPVFLGKDVVVENSIVGPNVSISEGSRVKDSIIKNSIIGKESTVENTILESSLIGDEAFLRASSQEYNIGPHSEITTSD
ncbi:MAG: NTP transferase domain-containing protein [Brevinematales bacterium]|nr:NTP transferase domain-containing protein [Brevinematales bacterium]